MNLIIIPDVHGRTFWKEATKNVDKDAIIFLGDYIDPYQHEGITHNEALQNFEEIIKFKKEHPDNVTLLLGNHDFCPYIGGSKMGGCRTNLKDLSYIQQLYKDNKDLFKVGTYKTIDNITYTFTHAPIEKMWAETYFDDKQPIDIIDGLNDMYVNNIDELCTKLNVVSYYRGGYHNYASPIWADVRELDPLVPEYENIYQVFGHTQLVNNAVVNNYFACLDCRKAFKLKNNKFIAITNDN